nr:MAG TPA_asm: hypothetical protein [Caudoviricetes sp.]
MEAVSFRAGHKKARSEQALSLNEVHWQLLDAFMFCSCTKRALALSVAALLARPFPRPKSPMKPKTVLPSKLPVSLI